jgi:hypothetical protein
LASAALLASAGVFALLPRTTLLTALLALTRLSGLALLRMTGLLFVATMLRIAATMLRIVLLFIHNEWDPFVKMFSLNTQ